MPQIVIHRAFRPNVFCYDIKLKGNNRTIPVRAMFDTGATKTAISKTIAHVLGLVPVGLGDSFAASGLHTFPKYIVCLELRADFIVPQLEVYGVDIGDNGYDVVIGMDIISQGNFSIMRESNKQTLIFQADYTK